MAGGGPVEVPVWAAALWFFGPYGFAMAVVAATSASGASALSDLALIAGLMLEQAFMVWWCPRLKSLSGCANVSAAMVSIWLCASHLECAPIRSMLIMELQMNGLLRHMHLLSSSRLRRRTFVHRLAFVTIFHDVDVSARWSDPGETSTRRATSGACRDLLIGLVVALASRSCLRYALRPSKPYVLSSQSWSVLVARTACGTAFIYSALTLIDCAYRLSLLMVRPRAIVCVPSMDAPYLAESFADFWGKRWDRPMQGILRHGIYLPLKRLLSNSQVFLFTFLASVILAFGIAVSGWVAWESCAMMILFFLLHATLVLSEGVYFGQRRTKGELLERKPQGRHQVRKGRYPEETLKTGAYGCGWLLTQMLVFLSAPLFVLPFLELVQL